MWRLFRGTFEPWRTFPGKEFDLLRALPGSTATEIYRSAYIDALLRLGRTWKWRALVSTTLALAMASIVLVWVAAAALGLAPAGRFVLDVVFHLVAAVVVFHPLARQQQQHRLPYIRAAVAQRLINWGSERYPELHDLLPAQPFN